MTGSALRALAAGLLVLLLVPTSGCLQDTERAGLEVSWDPSTTLWAGPAVLVEGGPAMLRVQGNVTVSGGETVELTGLQARIEHGNRTLDLTPVRLQVQGQDVDPSGLDGAPTAIGPAGTLAATWIPAPGEITHLPAGATVQVEVELQWRFRQDTRFDAGELELAENVTVEPAPGAGTGAVETENGRVTHLFFSHVSQPPVEASGRVEVYAVRTDGKDQLAPFEVELRSANGVLIAEATPPAGIPEGDGYIIYRLTGAPVEAAAVLSIGEVEASAPMPGIGLFLLVTAAAAWLGTRRQEEQ